MAGKAAPSVLVADAAGRAPEKQAHAEADRSLAYGRDELLKKYHGILRAFRAQRRRAPPRLRRWRRVMLFRARRAAFKKGVTSAGAAPPLAAWTAGDVCARLEQEGLPAPTVSRFLENEVSGADLLAMECGDLRQYLGLTRFGERKAAWAAVLRIRESAAQAAAASRQSAPQSAPSPAPPRPQLRPAAAEAEAPPEGSPPAAAQQLLPIYVDRGGETHCVEVSHLATVGELAAAVPGQGEMGVNIYFGGEALDNMTTLADAGIGAELRVEARAATLRIFGAGKNKYGQLGVPPAEGGRYGGVHDARLSPVSAAGLQPPQGAEIAELHCGRDFVLLRTVQGDVLHAGANDYGQRGDGRKEEAPHPELHRMPLPAPAVSIAAGLAHAAAVLSDGSVYTWGWNSSKQLGRGGDEAVPQAVPGISGERVSAGGFCTFAHRRGGEVSAWGANKYGQLCLGRASSVEARPQRVAALCWVPLLHLTGGRDYCIALRADGRALAWGRVNGRLADGSADWTRERGCLPIVLQIGPQLSFAAGLQFCGSVGRDGVLRLWGEGHAQQPTAVPLPGGAAAREVVCGGGYGHSTVFARSAGGEWAAMGSGLCGLPFGSGDEVQQLRPLPEALAGCRRTVTGPYSEFALYLCSQ